MCKLYLHIPHVKDKRPLSYFDSLGLYLNSNVGDIKEIRDISFLVVFSDY